MTKELSADFVVIGSGIIGSLTARKLAQSGASVLILEAGPRVTRGEIVSRFRNSPRRSDWMSPYPPAPWAPHPIYQPHDNGHLVQAGPYPYPAEYIRQFGGTTWHWAAHAWRNVPNDFRIQSLYGVGVDWPVTYEELEPYYQEAEEIMGVSGAPNTGSPRNKPFPMEPVAEPYAMRRIRERLAGTYDVVGNTTARNSRSYDGRPACCGNNSCQPICPIDAQYNGGVAARSAEVAGVKILTDANVYKLEHDAQGRITAALYLDPNKQSHRVTGDKFIVAANGIESPRLLLLSSSDRFPKGLANQYDMVGRHLMDHPSTSLTFDADEDLWLGRGPQSPSSIGSMRDGAFRGEHAPYRLDFTNISRVDGASKSLIKDGVYGVEFDKRLRHSAAREMSVKTVLEVLPNPENRISLSDQKDAMGIPKPQAHYSVDDYTRRGHERAKQDFQRIANLMGGSNLRFSKDGKFDNNQHICGTLRMGNDPASSVCDKWGRAHGHENLFLCSTGVIPTSGTCNSTENGLALALRTVDHILGKHAPAATDKG
ncbi:GMC family oxidoreductase [Ralstonia sp. SET104]|jgi:choline dehydrogenase-like flavoprotein|uniref:GMC family oxidoreductase n=1 Tax=Ralstonia sp. SET104 TaxID=2448774 RepID=UPI000F575A86|nr:GMC family oxidoreductase [Ralstonia sp. SET104]GCB03555.1 choline dehydrogenase [Ralstonia sp. SET104]